MPFRSNAERKACFAKLNRFSSLSSIEPIFKEFSEFNKATNAEILGGVKERLKSKSLRKLVNEPVPELDAGPFWGRVTTLFDREDSYFPENKFSDGVSVRVDIDPVKYTTGIIIEEAIRNYESNRIYYDKYGITKNDIIEIELAKNNLIGQET